RGRCRHFIFDWPNRRAALAGTASRKIEEPSRARTGGGTRRLEAHSSQPIASAFSQQFDELFIRPDQNSLSHLHDLDRNRTGARAFSLCLSWNAGAVGPAPSSRTNASANVRVLGLGRRAAYFTGDLVLMGRIALRVLRTGST